jgi:type IV pilus secretin PilQ/predicted competence protein
MAISILAISIASVSQQPIGRPPAPSERYNNSGDRIVDYFDVHAADIRSVLRQLSAYSGIDIISRDGIKASISLSVTNKSWREILGIVCMVYNLTYVEEQNLIYVLSREDAAVYGMGSGRGGAGAGGGAAGMDFAGPLIREVVPLRFTTATEMAASITPFLSPKGKLTAVKHTNALVVVDAEDNLKQIKELISQIDIQTAQISISCKIIEVSSGSLQNAGIHWGYVGPVKTGGKDVLTVNQLGRSFYERPDLGNIMANLGDASGEYMHNVTFGLLSPKDFGIALEYLFQDSKAEVVAQPQITTLNNKEAKVFMGQEIPINTKDDANNTVTQMVSVGTQLTVTPYVSGEGKIMLTLNPSKESYVLTGDGFPIISKQNATTNVLVNNGETVVIAGLTSNEKKDGESGIPFLKDIPILGYLFKRSTKSTDKRDLVIFVTPHIIHPGI